MRICVVDKYASYAEILPKLQGRKDGTMVLMHVLDAVHAIFVAYAGSSCRG